MSDNHLIQTCVDLYRSAYTASLTERAIDISQFPFPRRKIEKLIKNIIEPNNWDMEPSNPVLTSFMGKRCRLPNDQGRLIVYLSLSKDITIENVKYVLRSNPIVVGKTHFSANRKLVKKILDVLEADLIKVQDKLFNKMLEIEFAKLKASIIASYDTLSGHIKDDEFMSRINDICDEMMLKRGVFG
jgi:hypothetical protein